MRVLLIQVDGKWPNLALMKLSAYHKGLGDEVALMKMKVPNFGLIPFEPDWVYVSYIFSKNKGYAHGLKKFFKNKVQGLQIGGPGLEFKTVLPDFIEHLMPDYDLYGIDYSMGFTSRGCIRKCPWCIVPKLEGSLRNHASIREFLSPEHNKLILLDNNFLASSKWRENIDFILEHKLKISFTQGLDIRLVTDDNAKYLSKVDYYTAAFKGRYLYFAFDTPQIEKDVRRGVKILEQHGIPPYRLRFYMLCGFNTTHQEDMHRFKILRELGCDIMVMRYNGKLDDPWINYFYRWVNGRGFRACSWEEYDQGNSQEIIKREKVSITIKGG